MSIFLIGSDLYDIKVSRTSKINARLAKSPKRRSHSEPLISVLVPAHNEEITLQRNLESVYNSTYKNIELIVINDSSTDKTQLIARNFQSKYKSRFNRVKVLNVKVRGKARALNAGLKHARGTLFMCLDADSAVTPDAIGVAVRQFSDPSLVCLSSNIKIFPGKGALNLFQRIEYLTCYQMKKTETLAGVQYIVGGIGSVFRTKVVKDLGMYDTDTITEDMDLSMKIISHHGRKYHIGYHPEVVTYTEPVYDFKGLIRQRSRWRYGCYQVFFKYPHLFWSRDKKYSKALGWIYLPYALLGQILCSLEPLVLVFISYLLLTDGNFLMMLASFSVYIFYITMHISAATKGYSFNERLKLIAAAPLAYIGIYVLMLTEYIATVRGFVNLYKIYKNQRNGVSDCDWKHVERKGSAAVA